MQNHRTGDYIVLSSLSQIFKTCYYVITSPHTVQVGKVTSNQILILETSMIPTKTKNGTVNQLELLSLTLSYCYARFNSCSDFFLLQIFKGNKLCLLD